MSLRERSWNLIAYEVIGIYLCVVQVTDCAPEAM